MPIWYEKYNNYIVDIAIYLTLFVVLIVLSKIYYSWKDARRERREVEAWQRALAEDENAPK